MVNDIATQRGLLMGLFDGMPFNEALEKLTGIKKTNYTRERARKLISEFIELHCSVRDNIHPLSNIPPNHMRQLIAYIEEDAKGGDIKLFPDPPTVW